MWKLKDEETVRLFTREMAAKNVDVTKADDNQRLGPNDERSTSTQGDFLVEYRCGRGSCQMKCLSQSLMGI